MQMTGDVKSRPNWRLSCHTYSYPECQLGRLSIWETVRAARYAALAIN